MIFIGNSNRQARIRQDELMADAMMLSALNNAGGSNVYNNRMVGGSVYGQQRPANFYEQAIHMRHDMRRQREAYIEKQLEQNLPVCYLIIHCILLGCTGVVLLALQAYAVANNIATNIAYTGLWCGPIFMILTVLTLVLCKCSGQLIYPLHL